jgi:hypothetical protein
MQFNQVKKYDLNQNTNPGGLNSLYVDGSNAQAGDGSVTNPFKTIDAVINYLILYNLSGYTVKIAGGNYTTALSFDGKNSIYCEPGSTIAYTGTGYLFNLNSAPNIMNVLGSGAFTTATGGIVNSYFSGINMSCVRIISSNPLYTFPVIKTEGFVSGKTNVILNMLDGTISGYYNHCISSRNGARISISNGTAITGFGSGAENLAARCLYVENSGINTNIFENFTCSTNANGTHALVEFNGAQNLFNLTNLLFTLGAGLTIDCAILFSNSCSFAADCNLTDVRIIPSGGTFTYSLKATAAINIKIFSIFEAIGIKADPTFAITNIAVIENYNIGNTGAAFTLDPFNSNIQYATLNANTTLSIAALPNAYGRNFVIQLLLTQDGTGGRSLTLGAGLSWNGVTVPTLPTAAGTKVSLTLQTFDQGTTWIVSYTAGNSGLLNLRSGYDPTITSLFPVAGGSGSSGAIQKGDTWYATADGVMNGIAVKSGDTFFSIVNAPGQTAGNWDRINNELGFTPENIVNKATSFSTVNDTLYPTVKAAKTYTDNTAIAMAIALG